MTGYKRMLVIYYYHDNIELNLTLFPNINNVI